MNYNVVISGVGGQGVMLASKILAEAALKEGHKIRVADDKGLAQRGGSVVSHVRIGAEVHGPLIGKARANSILAFEPLEAVRHSHVLANGGSSVAIVNKNPLLPVVANLGIMKYPKVEKLFEALGKKAGKVVKIDVETLAKEAGSLKTRNMVMLGALAGNDSIPISKECFMATIREKVPPKTVDMNIRAFELGYNSKNVEKQEIAQRATAI